jgi:hypothetical protein
MANEITAAFNGLKLFFFSFIPIIIGVDPKISITANITMNALKTSLMLKPIMIIFAKVRKRDVCPKTPPEPSGAGS